jgi:hypothetical protein
MESPQLIAELSAFSNAAALDARKFKGLGLKQLNSKPEPDAWSILQCLEHLNVYGDYYLPEIQRSMDGSRFKFPAAFFNSGWIGEYFVNLIRADKGKMKKMKTPVNMQPADGELGYTTIDRFLKQMEYLQALLVKAENVDLSRTKTSIALTSMIKLRLGDTLRFVVYHIDRHIRQANRIALRGDA